ncbi:hypothetical protein Q7P37_002901 [Cladosporium fusiforme]
MILPFFASLLVAVGGLAAAAVPVDPQIPLLNHASTNRSVSADLFFDLEELARIIDITYCVGLTSLGINKPFSCLSRCKDFPAFELVNTWNTGPLLSDSCGYIAVDHGKQRLIVAFRGTYSIANTVVDLSTVPQEYVPYPGEGGDDDNARGLLDVAKELADGIHMKRDVDTDMAPKCNNCTVHMGFHASWVHTRPHVLPELEKAKELFPNYQLTLVGHSLGGAVAALAGLDLLARGYDPQVTTFGEPRIGNTGLTKYLDMRFNLEAQPPTNDTALKYRRVTHIDDPVPLLPLSEWGYAMHAGEIHISKPALSPDIKDLSHCKGDHDAKCIAAQDSTAAMNDPLLRKRDLIGSVRDEMDELRTEPWGIPSRYKLWQLFFAHRDYFWRIGLCVPGGDPLGGGGKYDLR